MDDKALDRIEASLTKLDTKFDRIEDKLDNHLERIAKVEEHSKTNRGAIALFFSVFLTVAGWIVYRLALTK